MIFTDAPLSMITSTGMHCPKHTLICSSLLLPTMPIGITTISVMFFHCVNFSFGFVSSCPIPLLSFAISPFCVFSLIVFSVCARLGFANDRKMSAISKFFVAHQISGWTFLITGIMSSISTSETLIKVCVLSSHCHLYNLRWLLHVHRFSSFAHNQRSCVASQQGEGEGEEEEEGNPKKSHFWGWSGVGILGDGRESPYYILLMSKSYSQK